MIMAIVSHIGRGQRSDGSGHNAIDYSPLKCNLGLYSYTIELEHILNGLLRRRFALLRVVVVRLSCDRDASLIRYPVP